MPQGHSVGTIFVELDLDYEPYSRAQKRLLRDATSTTLNIEKNFKNLGIRSSKEFDLMRASIHNSYNRIVNDSKVTSNDIIKAERAKNQKLKALNNEQFGHQTTLIEGLRKNWLAYSAAIYGIARGIGKTRGEFKDFEAALVDMGKVTSRSLTLIRDDILKIDPILGDSTSLMKGYYQTISAGVTDPVKALDLLTTAAKAARAAHIDQSSVIKALTKVMAGYDGQIKSTSEAADLLFRIEKLGQTTVAELVPIIGDVATVSKEAGVNQYEMAAALAQISLTAGSTSEAATQYRSILIGLLRPNEKLQGVIESLGYTSSIAMVKQLGLADSLKEIRKQADSSGVQIGKFFRSAEGLLGLASLSARGFEDYKKRIDEVGQGAGSAEQAFKEWRDSAEALDLELGANFNRLMIEIGATTAPLFNEAIKGISASLPTLSKGISAATNNFAKFWQEMGLASSGQISWAEAIFDGEEALERFNKGYVGVAKTFKINIDATKDASIYMTKFEKSIEPIVPLIADLGNKSNDAAPKIKKLTDEQKDLQSALKDAEKYTNEFNKSLVVNEGTAVLVEEQLRRNVGATVEYGSAIEDTGKKAEESQRDLLTWTKVNEHLITTMAERSRDAMSDIFFGVITGELDSLSDIWDSVWKGMLRTLTDMLAQMLVEWLLFKSKLGLADLADSFGLTGISDALGGGSSAGISPSTGLSGISSIGGGAGGIGAAGATGVGGAIALQTGAPATVSADLAYAGSVAGAGTTGAGGVTIGGVTGSALGAAGVAAGALAFAAGTIDFWSHWGEKNAPAALEWVQGWMKDQQAIPGFESASPGQGGPGWQSLITGPDIFKVWLADMIWGPTQYDRNAVEKDRGTLAEVANEIYNRSVGVGDLGKELADVAKSSNYWVDPTAHASGGMIDSVVLPFGMRPGRGDDGFVSAKVGEGILSKKGMDALAMLNSGKLPSGKIVIDNKIILDGKVVARSVAEHGPKDVEYIKMTRRLSA